MKTIKDRLAILLGTFFALFLLSGPTFGQSGSPPPPPPDPSLGAYYFDTTNWLSADGDMPLGFTNLVSVALWSRNALLLDTANATPAFLNYPIIADDGSTNISFDIGALKIVFISDWASADTNQYGDGPGALCYLLERFNK